MNRLQRAEIKVFDEENILYGTFNVQITDLNIEVDTIDVRTYDGMRESIPSRKYLDLSGIIVENHNQTSTLNKRVLIL